MTISKLLKYIKVGYRGAGIALVCGNEVLMQLRVHPPVWSFVGGGYDPGKDSSLLDTALREFYEETGIRLERSSIQKRPVMTLGAWRYKWILYLAIIDAKPDSAHGPLEFRREYQKYRYVDIYDYRSVLAQEQHKKTFFFVRTQMRTIGKMIEKLQK